VRGGRDGNALDLRVARGNERIGSSRRVIRNIREHPIDWLLSRRVIDATHHQAAQQFLADWEAAVIGRVRAASLDVVVDNSQSNLAEVKADALAALGKVLKQLGKTDRTILVTVLVHRCGLEQLTLHMLKLGHIWPERFAGPRLCEALQSLAEIYGLVTRKPITERGPVE
jgi:hypothetical protein